MYSFRDYHTIEILKKYESTGAPLDLVLRNYFRENKALGSKDRNYIGNKVYYIVRNLSIFNFYLKNPISWENRVLQFEDIQKKDHTKLPKHVFYSIPSWLYQILTQTFDEQTLDNILKSSLTEAPLTIRANTIKTSVHDLKSKLEETFATEACQLAPNGLKFFKREPVTSHPLFKQGYFEIQDEASQLAAELVEVSQGDHILDYCAGAGGKALAIAPKMKNKGVIYIHDIRSQAILEAKKRCERAGVHNVQFFDSKKTLPSNLKHKMDWIFVDAPCSGTGTFRRNPDLKWKLTQESLDRLIKEQQSIFEKALQFLKPNGKIIYATCSILRQENQDQVEKFIQKYNLRRYKEDLILLPTQNAHDGFFAATLMLADKD